MPATECLEEALEVSSKEITKDPSHNATRRHCSCGSNSGSDLKVKICLFSTVHFPEFALFSDAADTRESISYREIVQDLLYFVISLLIGDRPSESNRMYASCRRV